MLTTFHQFFFFLEIKDDIRFNLLLLMRNFTSFNIYISTVIASYISLCQIQHFVICRYQKGP